MKAKQAEAMATGWNLAIEIFPRPDSEGTRLMKGWGLDGAKRAVRRGAEGNGEDLRLTAKAGRSRRDAKGF